MRKTGVLLVMTALLAGCATMTVSKMTADNRMNLVHLSRGMTKAKVLAMMGSGVSVYNCDRVDSKAPLKVTINNPYRTEMIEASGATLEVVYYVTGLNNNNCEIEDNELTPLVFQDDKLIGWGKNFLLTQQPAQKAAEPTPAPAPAPEQAPAAPAPAPQEAAQAK